MVTRYTCHPYFVTLANTHWLLITLTITPTILTSLHLPYLLYALITLAVWTYYTYHAHLTCWLQLPLHQAITLAIRHWLSFGQTIRLTLTDLGWTLHIWSLLFLLIMASTLWLINNDTCCPYLTYYSSHYTSHLYFPTLVILTSFTEWTYHYTLVTLYTDKPYFVTFSITNWSPITLCAYPSYWSLDVGL